MRPHAVAGGLILLSAAASALILVTADAWPAFACGVLLPLATAWATLASAE